MKDFLKKRKIKNSLTVLKCLKKCPTDIVYEIIKCHELQYEKIDRLIINKSVFNDINFLKKLLKYTNINKVFVKVSDESYFPNFPIIAYVIKNGTIEMLKYLIELGIDLNKRCHYVNDNGYSVKAKPISLAFIRNTQMANVIRKAQKIHNTFDSNN